MSDITSNDSLNEETQADICVVCFKNVEIYSIGECDHPVCHECSTRMRVLCQQNECPICRKSLSKVIFTNNKTKYRDLEANNRSEYYNKKYKIAFENSNIQNAFYTFLDHPCPMCKCPPFHSFEALRDHVRREHEHFFCDICVEHLKIFTFERRCYNRHDLAMHRRKGDLDNKSHKGHPLCQYCDCRFLDRDELFRHLRKEHYFCHYCDADGSNEFYADYDSLREHFRNEHYLCEEGDCIREQFTAVFRSDIDLKAHFANVHGKSLNKQQSKHARTLQLEITLGQRGRSSHSQQENHLGANIHTRRIDSEENNDQNLSTQQQIRSIPIAPLNEQEFPSLGGSATTSVPSLMRPNMGHIRKYGSAGLARTKENFPALGSSANDTATTKSTNNSHTPASSILKGNTKPNQNKPANGMVIHVSNRPNFKNVPTKNDFPALPGYTKSTHSKYDDEDIYLSSETNNMNSGISAKHRPLIDNYVSVINPASKSKLQTIQENNTKLKKNSENNEIKLTNNDFPSLSSKSTNNIQQVSWIKTQKQRETENRKSKVALAPALPKKNEYSKKRETEIYILEENNKKKSSKSNEQKKNNEPKSSNSKNDFKKNLENISKKQTGVISPKVNGTVEAHSQNGLKTNPDLSKIKPPPGFSSITLNSVAKSSNSLTFTSSLGEIYDIKADHVYTPPPNADARNKELPVHFQQALQTVEAFNVFRNISSQFRQGKVSSAKYFEECRLALKEKFDDIFPELLALLPDISKQQDLYLEYQQYIKEYTRRLKPHQKLEMCYACKQVLKSIDVQAHVNSHQLNTNFPKI